jgi:hypothetical protein
MGLESYLSWLASNLNPLNLNLPSNYDDSREPLVWFFFFFLIKIEFQLGACLWFKPVILATQEAEIRRIGV